MNYKQQPLKHLMTKPKQYIQGWVEFYKLKFKVTPNVLIPRPETELLVDEVIRFLADHPFGSEAQGRRPERPKKVEGSHSPTILDVGTGSGNIAISVAKNNQDVQIIATDISSQALKVAKQNAKLHGVQDRIQFLKSDLLKNPIIHNTLYTILIIVANLPYIPSNRIPYLDSSVKDFEPHIALNGGEDGFNLYRKLFTQIKEKGLKPKLILGEIDYTHGELAYSEAQKTFPTSKIEVKTDLAHKQRILLITNAN